MNSEWSVPVDDGCSSVVLGHRSSLVFVSSPLRAYNPPNTEPHMQWAICDVNLLQLSNDERSLGIVMDNVIRLLDISAGRESRSLVDHRSRVTSLSPSSRSIYTWASGDSDGLCLLSDTRRHPSSILQLRTDRPIRVIQLSPDESLLAIGDHSSLQLFDLRHRKRLARLPFSSAGVCFHPSECLLASFGDEDIVRFWDLDTMECVSQSDPSTSIQSIHFTPDGESLAVFSTDRVRGLGWEPCVDHWTLAHDTPNIVHSQVNERGGRIATLDGNLLQILSFVYPSGLDGYSESEGTLDDPTFLPSPGQPSVLRLLPQHHMNKHTSRLSLSSQEKAKKTPTAVRKERKEEKREERTEKERREHKEQHTRDYDVIASIDDDHLPMMEELDRMERQVQRLQAAYKNSLEQAFREATDSFLLAGVCRCVTASRRWTLSLAAVALPRMGELLRSEKEEERATALSTISLLVSSFGPLINKGIHRGPSIGVDVAQEDRIRSAGTCADALSVLSLQAEGVCGGMTDRDRKELRALLTMFHSNV